LDERLERAGEADTLRKPHAMVVEAWPILEIQIISFLFGQCFFLSLSIENSD
jgi:hypothetical protein